jgi:hypothetical protein
MYITYGNYLAGTDIVAAVIDSTDIDLFVDGGYIHFSDERTLLMTPGVTQRSELSANASLMAEKFKSAQTYYNPIKIGTKNTPYQFIYVDPSSTEKEINWLKNRSLILDNDHSIEKIEKEMKESLIQKYFARHIITLSDILEGRLIERLDAIITEDDIVLDERLYQTYLQLLNEDFPF